MKLYKILGIINKKIDEAKFTLEAIFSTEDEDRHGDVIKQNWNLKDFKKNPVIINSHNYYDAAEVIGRAEKISIKDGQLQGKIKFAVNENPRARVIFDLYANGFLNAFSVGFIPKEFDDKGIILKSELLEISAVSVPANAMALAKAKGIDVNKLYESTNNDNFKNKKNDGKNAKSKNNDGKNNGEKGDDKNKKSKGNEKNKGDGSDKKKEARKKEYENWDNGEKEIRLKIRDIAEFEIGSFEKVVLIKEMPKIYATVGTLRGDDKKSLQMLFFPKDEGWTMDDAKKWFSEKQREIIFGKSAVNNVENEKGKNKKSNNQIILSAVNNVENENNIKKQNALHKILKAVEITGEIFKSVSENSEAMKSAENNRLINRTVRKLLELKN